MALTGTLTDDKPMAAVTCPAKDCGVEYMVPRHIHLQALAGGKARDIWCPNGHRWSWTESEADRLRKRVTTLEADLIAARARADTFEGQATRNWKTAIYWKGIAHRRRK